MSSESQLLQYSNDAQFILRIKSKPRDKWWEKKRNQITQKHEFAIELRLPSQINSKYSLECEDQPK